MILPVRCFAVGHRDLGKSIRTAGAGEATGIKSLDNALAKKQGSKKLSVGALAQRAGGNVQKKYLAMNQKQGQQNAQQRMMIRQQIAMVKNQPDNPAKSSALQKLTDEAKKLNVPKDKLNMWLGHETKSHMLYVDGPNGIFAVLEIVDTNYDLAKVIKILNPMINAKSYKPQFKELWEIGAQSRSEYLDHVGKIFIETSLSEDDVTEIALEHDVIDIIDLADGNFELRTGPKDLTEIKEFLENEHGKEIKIVQTELTHCSANPVEVDEDDQHDVELFEQAINDILAKPDFHMEIGNIYYNF